MSFALQVFFVAAALVFVAILARRSDKVVRRDALLEGAAALRRRAVTKWDKNPVAALEDEQCAMVLERMAGTLPQLKLEEVAA